MKSQSTRTVMALALMIAAGLGVASLAGGVDSRSIQSVPTRSTSAPDAVVPFTPLGYAPGRQNELRSSGEPGDLPKHATF